MATPKIADALNIEHLLAHYEQVAVSQTLTDEELARIGVNPVLHTQRVLRGLAITLSTFVLKLEHDEVTLDSIQVPATWWDHFKLVYFPEWLKRRYPVSFITHATRRERHIRVCPHFDKGPRDHQRFMVYPELDKELLTHAIRTQRVPQSIL